MKNQEIKALQKLRNSVHRGIKKRIKNDQRSVRHNVRQQLKIISREESA